ncbi:hypothetical protein CKQ90_33690, partial [Klebsiella pneumoniae]
MLGFIDVPGHESFCPHAGGVGGIDHALPEEKARGMTIDLGYAYWPQPDGRVLGFIDVPGHESFCPHAGGVGGIDHA